MARTNRNSGKGGSLLDNGVAAIAALSAGFVTYAMPEGLFARLIVASHIPDVLAAAQPPLGMKARLAVIAGVAILAYAAVWTLMRALDSLGGAPRPASAEPEVEVEEEAPRLRRADAHPDAPSRRPIRAGRDLGEPAFEDEPFELEPEAAIAPEPEPAFEPEFEAEPEPELEPKPAHAVEPLPPFLVPQEPEPRVAETPALAPAAFVEPSFEKDGGEEEPEEETGAYEGESDEQSLARLMQRFESGLGRKQQALEAAPPPPQSPPPLAAEPEAEAPPIPQERVGHRLRSAISDLNRMSAPGR